MEQQDQQNQEPLQGESPAISQSETPPPDPTPPPDAPSVSQPPPPAEQPAAPEVSPASQPPAPPAPVSNESRVDFQSIIREARRRKLETRLEKLLALARERGRITNNDIQKLLRVSDATATRYAKILVSRNLLKKSGKTRGVAYEPVL